MGEEKLDPNKEYTLILVKPDGYHRGLTGKILARIEQKGYAIAALRVLQASTDELHGHYEEHRDKHFFESMVDFMRSGKIVAAVIEGTRVVEGVRSRRRFSQFCCPRDKNLVSGALLKEQKTNVCKVADAAGI